LSGAFRINYGYRGKYLLTVTGRADGASVLAEGNKWSFFPSVAAAWRIKDEEFMANQGLFSDLKLRASYGVAGNAAVAPYQTASGLALIPYAWNDVASLAYGLNPQIGNPDLGWELTNTFNLGLDMGFLKNRIVASVDYYDSRTSDLLLLRKLPTTTGGNAILQNIGKTQNSGIEIAINTVNIDSRNFKWTSNITYTRNKERIVELPNGQNDIANSLFIGSPVNSFYDYQKLGIWQLVDSNSAKSFGYKPGDIRVADLDNSKTITAVGDRMVLGSAVPDYSIGFNNDFSFKGFDLNVFIYARQVRCLCLITPISLNLMQLKMAPR
jgi:outer membrane receptor protein involved in Fe transport